MYYCWCLLLPLPAASVKYFQVAWKRLFKGIVVNREYTLNVWAKLSKFIKSKKTEEEEEKHRETFHHFLRLYIFGRHFPTTLLANKCLRRRTSKHSAIVRPAPFPLPVGNIILLEARQPNGKLVNNIMISRKVRHNFSVEVAETAQCFRQSTVNGI